MNQSFNQIPFQGQPEVNYMSSIPNQTHIQTTAQQSPSPTQIFGLIVPGRNVITNFVPTDHAGTKFTLTLNFSCATVADNPLSVPDLVFFLLPNVQLPERTAAILYWSATSNNCANLSSSGDAMASGFELLGALTPSKTSGVFRTSWPSHEKLSSLIGSFSAAEPSTHGVTITLGVSIEPLENVANLNISEGGVDDRKNIGKKIALDLYNFLQSFDDGGSARNGGWMTVPVNVFDRWYKRFEAKLTRDPNYFMKIE